MCGIVGYVGTGQATDFLKKGLSKLEYRGYDSAGVSILNGGEIVTIKHKGRLENLYNALEKSEVEGNIGIGHTRWATHGEPSDINSHPHESSKGSISVVHNGIIENYGELKEWLRKEGYNFISKTDTEVIPNLIHYYYNGNLFEAVVKATEKLRGSYALAVVCGNEPDKIVAVRKDSPLIVGLGEKETFIASDIPAVIGYTRDIYLLEDNEFVIITKDKREVLNSKGIKIDKNVYRVTWNEEAAEKGGYDSFMLKEIHEQGKAIKDTLAGKINEGSKVFFDGFNISKESLENIDKLYIVACGTAYHAGLMGKAVIEKLARISVEVDIASEFRYRDPLITDRSLVVVISQSGETADTLAVLRDAKKKMAKTLAITNVVGSSVSREADNVIYTAAGPEIAVASTKAYTTQLAIIYSLGLYFAEIRGIIASEESERIKSALLLLPNKIEEILKCHDDIEEIAKIIKDEESLFFLGRGIDYALALEGSLKLKEISYIHSEAYAGGELKHGTIALIEEGTKVIALLTQDNLREKMISNIVEVKARGAEVIAITFEDVELDESIFTKVITIPRTINLIAPVFAAIKLQLLAYYTAKGKGCDIDKPRNLAKSVTVE